MLRSIWIWFLQSVGCDPRGIFRFYDGRRYRRVDPMGAARKLWAVTVKQKPLPGMDGSGVVLPDLPFEWSAIVDAIGSGDATRFSEAYALAADVAKQVFDVRPLEDGGLTEEECVRLLGRFDDYIGDVKKNSSGSPILLPFTGFPNGLPTNSNSDSGSTSTDSNSVQHAPSDSVPPLGSTRQ